MSQLKITLEQGLDVLGRFVLTTSSGGAIDVVGTASDAPDAVALVRRAQPDVVVLDLVALGASTDVVADVRAAAPDTRVIVISDPATPDDAVGVLAAGADGHLSRALDPQALHDEVLALVHRSRGGMVEVLDPNPRSARAARALAAGAVRAWEQANLEDAITLLISEVVGNAVRHADSDIELVIHLLPHAVRVEVRDDSPVAPVARAATTEDESGRGMALVEAISSSWGVAPHHAGKTVWFELPTDAGQPG